MRRLTERLAEFAGTLDGIAFINPHDRQGVYNLKEIVDWSEDFYLYKIANRLAAYEDTGLTPKEVKELAEKVQHGEYFDAVELAQIAIQTQRYGELREKYEESGQKCNRGHVNSLPLRLWTCPVCAEELAADRDLYKRAFEEVCRQFNFGDEKDYEDMRDAFLRMVADDESTEGFHEAWVRGKQALAEPDKEGER